MPRPRPETLRLSLLAMAATLAGCGTVDGATRGIAERLTPYKVEVVQGNFVSREQVEQLQPGMSRMQVRDILGTPLVSSIFHQDRWEYVFTMRRQGVEPQLRRLTVYFKGDALERHEGDPMPSESEFVATIAKQREVKVPPLEASEEQLQRAAPAKAAAPAPAPATAPAPPTASYPPLEPATR